MAASPFQFKRSRFLAAGAYAAAVLLAAPGAATAQAWKPQQQVEIVVGSAAGSSPDTMGRTIQRIWQEKRLVEVPATVMNRVGGGNTIAWTYMSQRPGDGHVLMISNINLSAGQIAYWEGVLAELDRDESWRAHLEKTQLDRQLLNGRETRQFQDELDANLRAMLGDLGLLKR